MTVSLDAFAGLPDSATLKIVPVEGGLAPERREAVLAVLRELLAQWRTNGAIRAGAVEVLADGAFVAVAWDAAGGDLSGCTKDGLTHTILAFEKQLGQRMANAPRLAVRLDGAVRFLTQGDFKRLRQEGRIAADTPVFDHLVQSLGDLRMGRFETTVRDSWYARIPA